MNLRNFAADLSNIRPIRAYIRQETDIIESSARREQRTDADLHYHVRIAPAFRGHGLYRVEEDCDARKAEVGDVERC